MRCLRCGVFTLTVFGLLVGSSSAADILWVNDGQDPAWDVGWTDLLTANGHNLSIRGDMAELDAAKIADLNASSLVIVSRSASSGNYATDAVEVETWNEIEAPLILMSPWLTRTNRWKWLDTDVANAPADMEADPSTMDVVDPSHPIFGGLDNVDMWDETRITDGSDVGIVTNDTMDPGNGTLLATVQASGNVWSVLWESGTEFFDGSGETPAGDRLFMTLGNHEAADPPGFAFGQNNSTADGEQIFLNAIAFMLGEDPPLPIVLGDVNLDTEVNGLDVDPFVGLVTSGTFQAEGDMNKDGVVNGLDVDPFVAAVVGGSVAAVPEPSTAALAVGLTLLLLGWRAGPRR